MKLVLGTALFALIALGIVIAGLPYLITRGGFGLLYESGYMRFLGCIPVAAGAYIWVSSARNFIVFGRGTPAPLLPPVNLVKGGIFQSVRNPMYLGVLLIILGEAILFQSVTLYIYMVVVWLAFHLFVVFYEEPRLNNSYGRIYEEYCKIVPRWIPRVHKYHLMGKRDNRQDY